MELTLQKGRESERERRAESNDVSLSALFLGLVSTRLPQLFQTHIHLNLSRYMIVFMILYCALWFLVYENLTVPFQWNCALFPSWSCPSHRKCFCHCSRTSYSCSCPRYDRIRIYVRVYMFLIHICICICMCIDFNQSLQNLVTGE